MTVRRFLRSFLVLLPIMSGAVILCELLDWPSALGYGFGAGIGAGIADAVDRAGAECTVPAAVGFVLAPRGRLTV